MNSIESITSKIISDTREYASGVKSNAEAQCKRIIDDARERAEKSYLDLVEKGKKECEAVIVRAASSADVLDRNILLDAKSAKIDQVFEQAGERLSSLDKKRYLDFLERTLKEAIGSIGRAEDDGFGYEVKDPDLFIVFLNKKDRDRLGKELISAAAPYAKKNGCAVALADACADTSGGLIVRRGDVEINATFEILLRDAREKYTAEISRVLF